MDWIYWRGLEREYVSANEFYMFEGYADNLSRNDDLFRARLKVFSDQWHERLGCRERIYKPPITMNGKEGATPTPKDSGVWGDYTLNPLPAFDPERRHYKTLHGTDIFILRDDSSKMLERTEAEILLDDFLYRIPFHPQDNAFMFVISADPSIPEDDENDRCGAPKWLKVFYYLSPYWVCLERHSLWLRGWWHSDKSNPPSCQDNDAQESLRQDLEDAHYFLSPWVDDSSRDYLPSAQRTCPFSEHYPPRTCGPKRVPASYRPCCTDYAVYPDHEPNDN